MFRAESPPFFLFPLQIRHKTTTSTRWVSLWGHLGALLLSASARLCPRFGFKQGSHTKLLLLLLLWLFFTPPLLVPVLFCLIHLLSHHVLLSNCHLVSWAEWPSRHQRLHLWSKCTNVNTPYLVLLFIYYTELIFNRASVLQSSPFLYKNVNPMYTENIC